MSTRSRSPSSTEIDYPTGDGKPVAETPVHRDILIEFVQLFRRWFAADPMAYVSGNMMMYYVEGDRRKHLSPDVFVTRGVPSEAHRYREAYFVWEEGKGPDLVIELTSRPTRKEDQVKKFELYRDVLKVREYFLFDPFGEYLKPPLKGYRLVEGRYDPIEPVDGRLPSEVTGLHLEAAPKDLRLYDPATGRHRMTSNELLADVERKAREAEARAREDQEARLRADEARIQAEADRLRSDEARIQAEADRLRSDEARIQAEEARLRSEAETERLRAEIEELRRRLSGG